jgi:signal transduction histidine kinase
VPEIVDILTKSRQDALTREVEVEEGRIYFASVTRLEDSDLDDTGSVCVLWDITHYKKVDSLKSEFVSTVSHDLRTPLTMMRGYATMLSMVGTLNTQQRDYVRKILESSKRMSRRVDNLLDLGRIEAGLGLKLEKIQLKEVIGEVVSVYRPQAVNKQLTLDVEITEELEAIEADPTLLQQALGNLVENAIKFTPSKGRVIIRLDEQEERQRIQVKDTGVGIAPMDQARLFERFFRSQAQKESGEGSSGLGLAIAKSIVEQHRGRIYLESRLGSGSTFTIELPKAPAARNSALDRGPG